MTTQRILALLLTLLCGVTPIAAFTFEEGVAALDLPDGYTATINGPTSYYELSEDALTGSHSLALVPTSDGSRFKFEQSFRIALPGGEPGLLTFQVKALHRESGSMRIDNQIYYLFASETPTWTSINHHYQASDKELHISFDISFSNLNEARPTLLIDSLGVREGIQITTAANNGSIQLEPAKIGYKRGETVSVSLIPDPGFRAGSAYVRAPDQNSSYAEEIEFSEFFLETNQHHLVRADFHQRITLGTVDAWLISAPNYDDRASLPEVDENGAYTIKRIELELENAPAGSLRFELGNDQIGTVNVSASNGQQWLNATFTNDDTEAAFQSHELTLPFAPNWLVIGSPNTSDPFSIRNLSFDKGIEVQVDVQGKGTTEVSYRNVPNGDGSLIATLTATPEEGWSFLKWTGSINSSEPRLELPINKQETLTAHFAEFFETTDALWYFNHSGNLAIEPLPEGADGPLFGFTTTETASHSSMFIEPKSTGKLSIPTSHGALMFQAPNSTSFLTSIDITSLPQRVSSQLSVYEGRTFTIEAVTYGELDLLQIDAPEGVVTVSPPAPHKAGDTVTIRVDEAYAADFAGWGGSRFSTQPNLTLTLNQTEVITPIFRRDLSTADYSLQSIGGRLWTATELENGIQRLDIEDLAPGEWADLETDFRGPLALKVKINASNRQRLSYTQGGESVGTSSIDSDTFYLILPEGKTSPLKIGIQNTTESIYSPSFEIHGMYQRATDPERSYDSQLGQVFREPQSEYYPIGSKVSLEALPNEGFEFLRWRQWESKSQRFEYTIKRDEALLLDPVFGMTFDSAKAQIPDSNFAFWSVNNTRTWSTKNVLAPGESQTFTVTAQGPGLLSFKQSSGEESVLVNGQPPTRPLQPLSAAANLHEILLESGEHTIEITLTNPEDSQYTRYLTLDDLDFHEGYVIGQLLSQGLDFTVSPASESKVYPAGSTVTLQASSQPLSRLRRWAGDLDSTSENATFVLDRHIFTSPLFSPSGPIGEARLSTQHNKLNAIYQNYGVNGEGTLAIHPVEERTSFSLTIPANTEISFQLDNRSAFMAIHLNDQLIYEGKDEYGSLIGVPAKPQTQTLRITVYFVPETVDPVYLQQIKTKQQFELSGDFGDANPYVAAKPDKDFYAPGEKVTIYLTGGAPKDWGFQDLITVYPNLGIIEWETERQVRSYEIEMTSDAVVGGKAGAPVSRSLGQVTAGTALRVTRSSGSAPAGGDLNRVQFYQGDSELMRLFTGSAKHIEFSARLEEGQFLVLPAYDGPSSESIFAGDGSWHAFSLPIPSGQEYLNLVAYRTLSGANDRFSIGDITLHSDYGASFITYGSGSVTATRTPSPTGQIQLKATPDGEADLVFWDTLSSGAEQTISINRVETAPASILFYDIAEPEFVLLNGKRYYSGTNLPETISSSVYQNDGQALSIGSGESIDVPVESNGPLTLRLAARNDGYDIILVEADGIEIARFENQPVPNYDTHFVAIPQGTRSLRIHGPIRRAHDINYVYAIDILDGYHISRLRDPSGQIFLLPNKDVYAAGERVEARAIPYAQYDFASWTHDRSDQSSAISIEVDGPIELGARFTRQITATSDKGDWNIRKSIQNGIISASMTLTPSGPGILRLPVTNYENATVTLDGTLAPYSEQGFSSYYLTYVPDTAKEIQIHVPDLDLTNGFSPHFQHGISAKIVGNTDLLSLSPARETYQPGETVTLSWKYGFAAPPGKTFLLNGQVFNGSLPISYTLEDHLIVDAMFVNDTHEDGYYSSADFIEFPKTTFNTGDNSSTSVNILSSSRESIVFGRHFEQGGTLSFSSQARNRWPHYMVMVNGERLPTFPPTTTSQFRIPPGGARVEWRGLPDPHFSGNTSFSLSDIRFMPDSDATAFQRFMAQSLSMATYAYAQKLGETDDYDRDGFSNLQEFEKRSNPSQYDIPVQIQTVEDECYLVFDLSKNVDSHHINVRQFNADSIAWKDIGINDLVFESGAFPGERIQYRIPLRQLAPHHNILRVTVLLTSD